MHIMSCGNVQREQIVDVAQRVPGVSCGLVLLGGMQLVGWERAVRGGQLLDAGQRPQRVVHAMPWREILFGRVWRQQRQRALRGRQLFCRWQRQQRSVCALPRRRILLGRLHVTGW